MNQKCKTSFVLTIDVHNRLRELAKQDHRSMSAEICWLVDQECARRRRFAVARAYQNGQLTDREANEALALTNVLYSTPQEV